MQTLVMVAICAATLTSYLTVTYMLPGVLKLIPEAISAMVALYIIAAGPRQQFRLIAAKYWLVFAALVISMICGLLLNDTDAGPTIAGMRMYLRAIPFFLLPATFAFTSEQIQKQLRLLLLIALVQLPLACYQRLTVWKEHRFTGDVVFGTLNNSGILSIFLVCAVLMITAFALRKRIGKLSYILLFFLLLIPTTINETKATVVLLPMGLLLVLVVGAVRGRRLQILGGTIALLAAFGAIFVPVYNAMQANNPYPKDITTFFTDKQQLNSYLEAKNAGVGATDQVGRGDAIRLPLQYLAHDPAHLAFGLGIGNASVSSLGKSFTGKYAALFEKISITGFATFILELGVLGTGLVFLLYWMIFRDAIIVARRDDGLNGAIAVGWVGITAVMATATFYTNTQVFESVSFLFWYFAGLTAARRMQLAINPVVELEAAVSPAPRRSASLRWKQVSAWPANKSTY